MVSEIPLTQGLVALVDYEDYGLVAQFKWWAIGRSHGRYYAESKMGLMHRFILHAKIDQQVDHRNRDGLDNKRINLRFATDSQQRVNQCKREDSSLMYKGVKKNNKGTTFSARIGLRGRTIYLGSFKSQEEAAYAYDIAAKEYYGEFANVNFN